MTAARKCECDICKLAARFDVAAADASPATLALLRECWSLMETQSLDHGMAIMHRDKHIQALKVGSGWLHVGAYMPTKDKRVLASEEGETVIAWWDGTSWLTEDDGCVYPCGHVTHWMAIPPNPHLFDVDTVDAAHYRSGLPAGQGTGG